MSESKKESRALPFEVERGFTGMPNAVSDYYTAHPRFTGAAERVYLYLLRSHNADKGYAYPGYKAIMKATKIGSDGTVTRAVNALKHLGLIRVVKVETVNRLESSRYYFEKPIECPREFLRVFGDELPDRHRKEIEKEFKDAEEDSVRESGASDLDDLFEWF